MRSQWFTYLEVQSKARPSNKFNYKDQAEHRKRGLCYKCYESIHPCNIGVASKNHVLEMVNKGSQLGSVDILTSQQVDLHVVRIDFFLQNGHAYKRLGVFTSCRHFQLPLDQNLKFKNLKNPTRSCKSRRLLFPASILR